MIKIEKLFRFIFNLYKFDKKIAFYINEEYMFDHYLSVIQKLDYKKFDIILANKFKNDKYEKLVSGLLEKSWNVVFLNEVFHIKKYKVLVSNHFFGGNTSSNSFKERMLSLLGSIPLAKKLKVLQNLPKQYFQNVLGLYNIRFMYGADVGGSKFDKKYNNLFDEFFCHGPRDAGVINDKFFGRVFEMGYPRYDNYFSKLENKELKSSLLKKHACNPKKTTILWIVTVSEHFSTIEKYAHLMKKLTGKYNVILRPHPLEIDPQYSRYNSKVHKIVKSNEFLVSTDAYQNMLDLYLVADYVFCDYGGSIFSALYLDKKILLMDHEEVKKDIEVYESTSLEIREYLASISKDSAETSLKNICNPLFWEEKEPARLEARSRYFGNNREGSSLKAAKRLMKILEND